MESKFPETTIIRQYLLGQLGEEQALEESLSEEMLFDDELAEVVDSVEDEVIEEYLDGSMSRLDKESFERFFLRPRERRQKLEFARLLRQHLSPDAPAPVPSGGAGKQVPRQEPVPAPPIPYWRLHARTLVEVFALLLLTVVSLNYFSGMKSKLEQSAGTVAKLENELKQEQEKSAALVAQLEALHPPLLTLEPDLKVGGNGGAREVQEVQVAEVRPGTQKMAVELILKKNPASAYDVQLQDREGKRIWSSKVQPVVSSSQPNQVMTAQLKFEIPAQGMSDGAYSFSVSPLDRDVTVPVRYSFMVRTAK